MSDNGKKLKKVLTVEQDCGKLNITFDTDNLALLSHCLRIAGIHLDELISSSKQPNEKPVSDIVIPMFNKVRGRNG